MELWDSPLGGTLIHNHDATASDHSAGGQPVLTDTIGGNNATGSGFIEDGSAWVDLGGGAVTADLATTAKKTNCINRIKRRSATT